MTPIRLVAPFLPLPPESVHHQALEGFDWMGAIRMLSHSAEVSCGVPVQVITDSDADLPMPCFKYPTTHRRLMLWTLEACVKYLESDDFDRDTVMLDCDVLIYQDLARFFSVNVDLKVLIRPTHKHKDTWKKILNGVQFWNVRGKQRLAAFYRDALTLAEQMNDGLITWGADTEALRQLLEPVDVGLYQRHGLRVEMLDYVRVMEAFSQDQIDGLKAGIAPRPIRAVTDFRYARKRFLRQAYEMTIGRAVTV